ncbi:MAG: addiction module protein, partial [Rhodothermales bacterium]|nr:addiction module protein [Rhodothermales bacterium]
MDKSFSKLESEARNLSPKQRARLVRRLIATLDQGQDADSEQLWLDEAESRLTAYRNG